jgi:succinyl-CoA synthetase beta subunit
MARLHEYQAKALLAKHGFTVPRGGPASTPKQAGEIARSLGGPAVVKIQAWTTGRKAIGGVVFADNPEKVVEASKRLLSMTVGHFPVTEVLVEELVAIQEELFVSLALDDAARAPVILLALAGGSGIEDRAGEVHRLPCDPKSGPDDAELKKLIAASGVKTELQNAVAQAVHGVFEVARTYEARSLEINPLVTTTDGRVIAADCRMTIDDYAVFRHPELGIEIARELDHPPAVLERIAYDIEQADHRGTFYFAQLNTKADAGSKGLVGFHGAGGGGSMMSMDAIMAEGFTIANFTDTSGNPSAAKVYRAARIILSQPGLVGYFGSGSGVASQEQFWSAYGLAKAFWELQLSIPAVIRLGGNSEDRAVEVLNDACADLPGRVEGYKKDDTPRTISQRFAELVSQSSTEPWQPRAPRTPAFVGSGASFPINGGTVWIDTTRCDAEATKLAVEHSSGLLKDDGGVPVLAVNEEDAAGKDSEFIACEVELRRAGKPVVYVELDVPGLEEIVSCQAFAGEAGGSGESGGGD